MPERDFIYLFRGTTRGWPGNDILRSEGITCTTTDPLVATLFAIECRNHGRAVILAARLDSFSSEERSGANNHFGVQESARNLRVQPSEFERRASVTLEIDQALIYLRELGFSELPIRIQSKLHLMAVIEDTYRQRLRMSLEQIGLFNSRMTGGST